LGPTQGGEHFYGGSEGYIRDTREDLGSVKRIRGLGQGRCLLLMETRLKGCDCWGAIHKLCKFKRLNEEGTEKKLLRCKKGVAEGGKEKNRIFEFRFHKNLKAGGQPGFDFNQSEGKRGVEMVPQGFKEALIITTFWLPTKGTKERQRSYEKSSLQQPQGNFECPFGQEGGGESIAEGGGEWEGADTRTEGFPVARRLAIKEAQWRIAAGGPNYKMRKKFEGTAKAPVKVVRVSPPKQIPEGGSGIVYSAPGRTAKEKLK